MAKPKSEHITLDLSGTRISYDSPVNYSKDYPRSAETQYRVNIHDQDLYKNPRTNAENLYVIRQSHWDYGRSLIWRSVVKGTLSMSARLYRSSQNKFDPKDHDAFIKTLRADFEQIYDKKTRKDFKVILPEKYQMKTLSGIAWGYYEFTIRGGRRVAYAYPLSDQHYIKVQFEFIGEENNWQQQAQATIDFIMASFEVK